MTKTIPAGPIRQALQTYLDDRHISAQEFCDQHELPYAPILHLLDHAETLVFDLADIIACRIGQPFIFNSPELIEAYMNVDLSGPIRLQRRGVKSGDDECLNGHERTEGNTRYVQRDRGRRERRCMDCQREVSRVYRENKKVQAAAVAA